MHHACTDIYVMRSMLIPNPIGHAQLQLATQMPEEVLVCFLSQNIFRIMIGVSHDARLMFAGIMMILRLNQVL